MERLKSINSFNYFMGIFDWLFGSKKLKRIKIIDPDGLFKRDGAGRGYHNLKKTYNRLQLSNYINGKKVKFWKIVYGADDEDGDRFIPIFCNLRRRRK